MVMAWRSGTQVCHAESQSVARVGLAWDRGEESNNFRVNHGSSVPDRADSFAVWRAAWGGDAVGENSDRPSSTCCILPGTPSRTRHAHPTRRGSVRAHTARLTSTRTRTESPSHASPLSTALRETCKEPPPLTCARSLLTPEGRPV